jgi:hypothetical protein
MSLDKTKNDNDRIDSNDSEQRNLSNKDRRGVKRELLNEKLSRFREFINAPIITLFLGSVVFAGLVENYKDDLSFRRSIVSDTYRPMLKTQVLCKFGQQKLILKIKENSAGFKQILNEIDNINIRNSLEEISEGEKLFLESFVKGIELSSKEVNGLRKEKIECQQKLLRHYEEISLLTGTYENFKSSTKKWSNELEKVDMQIQIIGEENINYSDIKQLVEKMGDILENDDELNRESLKMIQNLMPDLRKFSEAGETLTSLEEKKSIVEARYHEEMHEVFAHEINYRFRRGIISKFLRFFS